MNFAEKTATKIFRKNNIQSIEPAGFSIAERYKFIVYVPLSNVDELTFAMASAGAGRIGKYEVCSFRTKGIGTFIGSKQSTPAIGRKNRFEMVEEIKLEMICDKSLLKKVIETVYRVHPYEEPACEIYKVYTKCENNISKKKFSVTLKREVAVRSILSKINSKLDLEKIPSGINRIRIKKVIFDYSGSNEDVSEKNSQTAGKETLSIKKNNKILNIELI